MTIIRDNQLQLRRYLLGQLAGAEEEAVELRLLTDADYSDELGVAESGLVDEYLEGTLSEEERSQFERHFLKAPERRDDLALAAALHKAARARASGGQPKARFALHEKRGVGHMFLPPVYLKAAAIITIVLGVGLGAWLLTGRRPDGNQGLAALGDIYKDRRFIEARIAGLGHAPLTVTRGQENPGVDEDALRQEELRLLIRLKERQDAEAHHALGRFYLAGLQFDKAIGHLEQALGQEPGNAQIHNDLGVALLEKGKAETTSDESGEGLKYFARSRDEIGRALELDGSLLEALYNRAVVRQHLMMWQQAEDDWREYLKRDPDSPWAGEAQKNLRLLEGRRDRGGLRRTRSLQDFLAAYRSGDDEAAWEIYTRSHASAGNSITNALLDSYLDSQARGGGGEALRSIQALTYLGEMELQRVGDRYTSDLARFYGSTTPQQRALISSARHRVKAGAELSGKAAFTAAINNFALAGQEFARAGDVVEAAFADYAIAHCYALQPDIDRGLSIFARITPACESMGYKWLLAQCLRTTAHLRHNLNDYSEAIDISARSLSVSEQVQDHDGLLRSLTQIAALHQSLNDTERSLHYLLRSLVIGREYDSEPKDVWGRYIAMSFNFNALGYYGAALDYQREALSLAAGTRIPLLISRSYEYIGQTYGNLKLYGEAIAAIELAYRQGESLPGEPAGLNMMASASLQLGDIHRRAGSHAQAVEAYDKSIALYDELKFYHYSSSAHKGKLLSYLAQENDALASEELRTVLRIFEEYRGTIVDEGLRNIFFDNEQSVYDLAIDFEFSRMNNPRRAFEYSEESRARSLLNLVRNGGRVVAGEGGRGVRARPGASPPSLSEIKVGMPDGVQLLQYAVLEGKLLIWLISGDGFFHKAVPIGSGELNDRVAAYLKSVTSLADADAEEARKTSTALHDLLVRPLEEHLVPGKPLCIVPDKALNAVPFGALISAKSARHLVEDYRLIRSPSSAMFNAASAAAAKRGTQKGGETLLSVGDPSFDRLAFPRLPRLPSAAREAEEIANYYKSPEVLLGEKASVIKVKAALEKSNVAHLATHYVADRGRNMRSKLVLASEPAGEAQSVQAGGALEPRAIYQMELPVTRVVVLSGCQTGIERQYKGEGPISLARSFIAVGVPVVVASLWPVDSDATAELMISFHRHRKHGALSTAEALRQAQLEMLTSRDQRYRRPYYWASFVTIGGHADF